MRACARAGTRARALAPLRCILVCAFMFAYCAYDGVGRCAFAHDAHNERMRGRHWGDCDCARACLRLMGVDGRVRMYALMGVCVGVCLCMR